MSDTQYIDNRTHLSKSFSTRHPLALLFGASLREMIAHAGLSLYEARDYLDCPSINSVLVGQWIPRPGYMRDRKWDQKLKAIVPAQIFNKPTHGGLMLRYMNEEVCSIQLQAANTPAPAALSPSRELTEVEYVHIQDPRQDYSQPFPPHSEIAQYMSKIIGEIVEASGKTVTAAAKHLEMPNLKKILDGDVCPSPFVLENRSRLKKMQKMAPEVFERQHTRAFFDAYVSKQDCGPYTPQQVKPALFYFDTPIPITGEPHYHNDKGRNTLAIDRQAIEQLHAIAAKGFEKLAESVTQNPLSPTDIILPRHTEQTNYLDKFHEAFAAFRGEDLNAAFQVAALWPNLWKNHDACDKATMVAMVSGTDPEALDKTLWMKAAVDFTRDATRSMQDRADLAELYKTECGTSRKAKKKHSRIVQAMKEGKEEILTPNKVLKALSWMRTKLEDARDVPSQDMRLMVIDHLIEMGTHCTRRINGGNRPLFAPVLKKTL